MARNPRQFSASGFYHVVCRGNGKQLIFEDDEDRSRFLGIYASALSEADMSSIAWCLMGNHIHLLVRDDTLTLSSMMQKVLCGYAKRYNSRTKHVGHLFQERFYSTPVEDDECLLMTARYIHQNPLKGGLSATLDYRWSSYGEYLGRPGVTETSILLDLHGSVEGFVAFNNDADRTCYRFEGSSRIPNGEVLGFARQVLGEVNPASLKTIERPRRNSLCMRLHDAGLSARQIERLTGIGRGTIEYVIGHARQNLENKPVTFSRV